MKAFCLSAAIVLAASAYAADDTVAPPANLSPPAENAARPVFAALDKDHDGQLSREEAAANRTVASKFAAADSNTDGYLTSSEFKAYFETERH